MGHRLWEGCLCRMLFGVGERRRGEMCRMTLLDECVEDSNCRHNELV